MRNAAASLLIFAASRAAAFTPRAEANSFARSATVLGFAPYQIGPMASDLRWGDDLAEEAFSSLRPADKASFECNLPELTTVCVGDEECEVGDTVRSQMLEWLEGTDQGKLHNEYRGRRIFRYNSEDDSVAMSYYAPDSTLHTERWPWSDHFYALYDWDMMC